MKDLSIVIPVYNAEKYIAHTLDSIVNQSFDNYEIIIIDDGSTDSSLNIIKKYAKLHKNIKIIEQKNKGATHARNIGLEHGKGEYIIFFDADDVMIDNTLINVINQIKKENSDLLISDYLIVDEALNEIGNIKMDINSKNDFRTLINETPFPGNKVYKKSIIDKHNIIFDDVKIGQDLNFYVKYCLHANSVSLYKNDTVKYRVVNTGISKSIDSRITDIMNSFKYIKKHYCLYKSFNEYKNIIYEIELKHYVFQYSKLRKMSDKLEKKHIKKYFSKSIINTIKKIKITPENRKEVILYLLSYMKTTMMIIFN